MNHEDYSDRYLREILLDVRSIAMVGASTTWNRPSYFVMKYLKQKGYRVIPVNPRSAGQALLGETVCSGLDTLPEQVDMVDMFRPAGEAGQHLVVSVPALNPLRLEFEQHQIRPRLLVGGWCSKKRH